MLETQNRKPLISSGSESTCGKQPWDGPNRNKKRTVLIEIKKKSCSPTNKIHLFKIQYIFKQDNNNLSKLYYVFKINKKY